MLVQNEGGRSVKRNIDNYNLDMIIALGYRVQSEIAVRFRIWATQRLHEYIQKGFTMEDERLKQGGNRYFKELLQRIRDIRSSERNPYGVDVNSGCKNDNGIKDKEKVKLFIKNAKGIE